MLKVKDLKGVLYSSLCSFQSYAVFDYDIRETLEEGGNISYTGGFVKTGIFDEYYVNRLQAVNDNEGNAILIINVSKEEGEKEI